MIESNTFCIMPFISVMLNTDGKMRYCCIASGPSAFARDENNNALLVGKNSISDAWNSEVFKKARQDMLEGNLVDACKHCYKQETLNVPSYRTRMTDEWKNRLGEKFYEYIKAAVENDNTIKLPPVYLDLRLGNLCNLKCRMCNPFNSSQIAKEHFKIIEEDDTYKQVWSDQFGPNPLFLKDQQLDFDTNFMWNDIISMIPNLTKVYMTGGEPTLINNNYRFMEEIISAGYQNQIELFFNINCTNVTDKFVSLVSKFPKIQINCSIDGYKEVNDYIRSPSKWEKIDENFQKLAQTTNIRLDVSPVIQVYNVLDCHNMLHYVESIAKKYNRFIGIDFLINDHPHFLDVTILPKSIREQAAKNLEAYDGSLLQVPHIKNSITGIINLMRKDQHNNSEKLLNDFVNYTKSLDKARSENFSDVFPKLAKELQYE